MYEHLRTAYIGCLQLYSTVDFAKEAGVMWSTCKEWVEGLDKEVQRVGKRFGGLPAKLDHLPRDMRGIYGWIWG